MNTYYPEPANEALLKRKRTIETGFPSPATDHLEERLNLQEYVVRHPASTFFSRVAGNEEAGFDLRDGDILVIDRSLAPKHDCLVIAEMEGEYRVCKVLNNRGSWLLETGDGYRVPVSFESGYHSTIWGRITHIVKSV